MILKLKNIKKKLQKNSEIVVLFFLIIVTVISTKFYNDKKKQINDRYKNVINNIYFQKSLDYVFNNLSPEYLNIDHKISKNETFDKILEKYSIPTSEIKKVKGK